LYTPDQLRQTLAQAAGEDEDKWECADGEVGRWKVEQEKVEDKEDTTDTKK
jgi:hypothetical protein